MEDVTINGLTIRKNDALSIDIYRLGQNPDEWIEPAKFCPERFDPESEYFLTPAGKKRNPYSFSPFLGGQRVCIGKALVETISKITLPTLWLNFEFEFDGVKPENFKMPANNMICTREPEVNIIITKKPNEVSLSA